MADRRIRALIVDDEPLARKLLREMLGAHPDVEVVGEAGSGRTALERLDEQSVDLIFLDIEMPGLSGLEVVEALLTSGGAAAELPLVIFVTAYDRYAVHAFDVHAFDYVLKPLDQERFSRALQRARIHLGAAGRADQTQRIVALLEEMHRRERFVERLPIKVGERTYLQHVEEIDWIEADGKYVAVHVGKVTHTIRDTLAEVAEALDPAKFIRISRSAVVNVAKIREVQPWFRGEYVVILDSGAKVNSTRSFRDNLTRLLERKR